MWHHSKAQTGVGTAGNPQNEGVGIPDAVLAAYGWLPAGIKIEAVQPGFSGASVWKVTTQDQAYALKRWPIGQPAYFDLPTIHRLMQQARQSGLSCIPEVQRTRHGDSVFLHDGVHWDTSTRQPGLPQTQPSEEQLKQAMNLLTTLHALWRAGNERRFDICPAVTLQHRRLMSWTVDELEQLRQQAPTTGLFREAVLLFDQYRSQTIKRLEPWLTVRVSLHPCLGDVWSEHVLFEGNQITGLIDFGGMRYDHPAQDLARLLGSYTQGDALRRQLALVQYAPATSELEPLTILLDDCGTIVGLGNWLRWLRIEKRRFDDQARAIARLQGLLNRLTHMNSAYFSKKNEPKLLLER